MIQELTKLGENRPNTKGARNVHQSASDFISDLISATLKFRAKPWRCYETTGIKWIRELKTKKVRPIITDEEFYLPLPLQLVFTLVVFMIYRCDLSLQICDAPG